MALGWLVGGGTSESGAGGGLGEKHLGRGSHNGS